MARRASVIVAVVLVGAVVVGTLAAIGIAQSGKNRFDARKMVAEFEVPAVSSDASGSFEATLDGDTVRYTLSFTGLESDVRQAHIHFAQRFASGGIAVWLCETSFNPAPAAVQAVTPDCPGPRAGEVSDSFDASEVVGPATQGISAGEFDALLEEMRKGFTYANVHSASIPGGEIRGQIKARGGDGDEDDDDD